MKWFWALCNELFKMLCNYCLLTAARWVKLWQFSSLCLLPVIIQSHIFSQFCPYQTLSCHTINSSWFIFHNNSQVIFKSDHHSHNKTGKNSHSYQRKRWTQVWHLTILISHLGCRIICFSNTSLYTYGTQPSNPWGMQNPVCMGFGTAMRTGSSRRFKRYPQ